MQALYGEKADCKPELFALSFKSCYSYGIISVEEENIGSDKLR